MNCRRKKKAAAEYLASPQWAQLYIGSEGGASKRRIAPTLYFVQSQRAFQWRCCLWPYHSLPNMLACFPIVPCRSDRTIHCHLFWASRSPLEVSIIPLESCFSWNGNFFDILSLSSGRLDDLLWVVTYYWPTGSLYLGCWAHGKREK